MNTIEKHIQTLKYILNAEYIYKDMKLIIISNLLKGEKLFNVIENWLKDIKGFDVCSNIREKNDQDTIIIQFLPNPDSDEFNDNDRDLNYRIVREILKGDDNCNIILQSDFENCVYTFVPRDKNIKELRMFLEKTLRTNKSIKFLIEEINNAVVVFFQK